MTKKKELLTVEFRYNGVPIWERDSGSRTKKITIGIFDTLEEAISAGNQVLTALSKDFQVRENDRFSLNGGPFGSVVRLVTNCCYPTQGVQYFAKIKALHFVDLPDIFEVIDDVFEETNKYIERYKNKKAEEDS